MGREKGTGSLQLEKSGRWTVRVGINGKRLSRSTGTRDRAKAEVYLQRYLSHLGLGQGVRFGDVWAKYVISPKRRDLTRATLDAKRNVWMHFARWIEGNHLEITSLGELTAEAVGEYLLYLRSDHCASTYNNRICVLREVCRTVGGKNFQLEDPWDGIRLLADDSRSRRELTLDEVQRLLEAATGEWKSLFLIGLYTGLRLGDSCLLEWKDIDLDHGILQVIPRKTRKHAHGHPVTIPLHPALLELLNETRKADEAPREYVLPKIAAAYLEGRWKVSEPLKKIFKRAGITMSIHVEGRRTKTPLATFHSLRHTFVSAAANAGVPLATVASIVGHSSTAMTRHYYHENLASLTSAVNALPRLL